MFKGQRALTRRLRRGLHERDALRRLQDFHGSARTPEQVALASIDLGSKEIVALAQAVAAISPRNILEIGTYRGGTLLIWTQLASHKVVTCDLDQPDYRRRVYAEFSPSHSACQVIPLEGDSHDASFRARVEKEFDGERVDFLFIDGDHTAAGVTADYEDYRDLVRPGGLIGFHDILENQPLATNQVYELWKRLRSEAEVVEFVDDPGQCGFGIGVVRV